MGSGRHSNWIQLAQKWMAFETSSRSGTVGVLPLLEEVFPKLKWQSLPAIGLNAVCFSESQPESFVVDQMLYFDITTGAPSNLPLWTETEMDPLKVTLKKGTLYGLGMSHPKVSLIPAVQALIDGVYKNKNIVIALGYGRNQNMMGARRILHEVFSKKTIRQAVVAHPTSNRFVGGSVGQTKMEVFFPFSEEEKKLRQEHDLKEALSSRSKVFPYKGGGRLSDNVIYRALESCVLLPQNTLTLDLSAGVSTSSEPESLYFELDFVTGLKESMAKRLGAFSEILLDYNERLLKKFMDASPQRALHVGKVATSTEGVSFYGANLIPAKAKVQELLRWFKSFQEALLVQGAQVRVRDTKKPFLNRKRSHLSSVLSLTESTVFGRKCKDVLIFGVGQPEQSAKPNESIRLTDLDQAYEQYKKLYQGVV